jgi:hypothetical protein
MDILPVTDEWLEKGPTIQIFVKTLTGKTIMFKAYENSTVLDLKEWIRTVQDIPLVDQRLIFAGKMLEEDDKTLESYNVLKESTVHLVLKLSGC